MNDSFGSLKEFELKCCKVAMGSDELYSVFYAKCYWIEG